jgi:DNA polymerase
MRAAVDGCRACDLWEQATQAVFGQGPAHAQAVFVGETPGDREDVEGRPFVGPAGRVLDRALEEAGIERKQVYLTNAVKHFRYRARGKRRIHQRPDSWEIAACRPWVEAEIAAVRPDALVCMGAVAAQSLLGRDVRVTRDRGRALDASLAPFVTVTVHPSSILRGRDEQERHAAYAAFVDDLEAVRAALDGR